MKIFSVLFITGILSSLFSGLAGLQLPWTPSSAHPVTRTPQIVSRSVSTFRTNSSPALSLLEQSLRAQRALSTSA